MAGGYWQQLPSAMQQTWVFRDKRQIELECEDARHKHSALKKERGLSTWEFQVPTQPAELTR